MYVLDLATFNYELRYCNNKKYFKILDTCLDFNEACRKGRNSSEEASIVY